MAALRHKNKEKLQMSELLRIDGPTPRAIGFYDVDNTLIDADDCIIAPHEETYFKETGVSPEWGFRREIQKVAGGPAREVFRYLYRKRLKDLPEEEQEAMIDRLDASFGQEIPHFSHLVRPIRGVPNTLEKLAAKGVMQVIVTNRRPETLEEALERGGMGQTPFAEVYARDRVEALGGKAGAILDFMARDDAQGLPAVMVGDAVGDIKAGVEAGIRSVGVLPPGRYPDQQFRQWLALRKAGAERIVWSVPQYGRVALRELERKRGVVQLDDMF